MATGENFTVRFSDGRSFTVLAVDRPAVEKIRDAVEILRLSAARTIDPRLLLRVGFFLASNRELITSIASNVLYLKNEMIEGRITYLLTDIPPVELEESLDFARSSDEVPDSLPRVQKDDLQDLALFALGAPAFLKKSDPRLFSAIEISLFQTADADFYFEELMTEFKHSRPTVRALSRVKREAEAGDFREMSREEVERRVVSRFWKPARGAIGNWLDRKLKFSDDIQPVDYARQLLSRRGRGLAFVDRGKFAQLELGLGAFCRDLGQGAR